MPRFAWVFALLAACGGAATSVRNSEPYEIVLRIEGGTIDPDDLIPRLGLSRSHAHSVDDYQLSLDLERIKAAYQRRGFFAVEVKSRFDKPPPGGGATIVFTVTQGPRAAAHVELTGLPADIPESKARALVKVDEGAPFDYDTFEAAKELLQDLVQDAGYAHARMVSNVIADRVRATAVLRYTFDPGPLSKFGLISLSGATGKLAEAAQFRLRFREGERFSITAIEDSQTALYSTGLFSSVRIEPDQDTDNPIVPVKITVTQVTKNELSWGGGVGFDPLSYSIRARLQYIRHGVITPLTTSNSDLRPGYAFETATCNHVYLPWTCKTDFRGRAIETLSEQDFLLPDVRGEVEGGVDYLVYEAYAKLGAHARLGVSAPARALGWGTDKLKFSIGWRFEVSDFPSVYIDSVDAANLGIDRVNYVGAYTTAVELDLRDHPLEPTKGLYADVRVTKGTRYALGDFNYLQLTPGLRLFWPLGPTVLALRGRLGTISGDVPATERYYGGGIASMRGFGQRGLSPRALSAASGCDVNGVCTADFIVIGGTALLETSVELRIPLIKPFGAVVFFDGGDVKRTWSELDPSQEYFAVGFGLRWLSPIGPIGADLAYRLNRVLPNESHFNPLFAIGEAF